MARAAVVVGRDVSATGPAADVLRALLPALVNGTKEKNTYVRANSELALRAVLRLPKDEQHAQVRSQRGESAQVGDQSRGDGVNLYVSLQGLITTT